MPYTIGSIAPSWMIGIIKDMLKSARGRVSFAPLGEHWLGLAGFGAITRGARDMALVMDVISGNMAGDRWRTTPPTRNELNLVSTRTNCFNLRCSHIKAIPNTCAIDLLIFAQIVYWDYSDIPEQKKIFAVKDLFHTDMEKLAHKTFYPDKNIHLFRVLYANPRYRNIPIIHRAERFSSQREEQFAAIVIIPCPNTAVISFQGTDSSLLGWKENFNMACRCPVPAQLDAKNFLEKILPKLKEEKIYLVGHSKGGNLAEYAAITIDDHLGRRITKVLDFDGPGFREEFIQANRDKEILKRIKKYSPASSIVGSIMKSFVPIRPIQSSQYFMLQHDPFTWLIYQQGFLRATELSRFTKFFHESHINWLNDISDTDRQIFVDASYKMISALTRSEERRVGKECRSRWSPYH